MNRLTRSLHWLRRIDSRMLLVFMVLAPSLVLFVNIASEVMEGDTLAYDRWLLQALRSTADPLVPAGPDWLRVAMIDFTALGGGPVLTLVTLLAAGYLLARRKRGLALFLGIAVAAGALLNTLLKHGFVRERPDVVPHLVEVSSASFPSGHAMNSAMVYLTLAALLVSAERKWRVRLFLMSAAILLTLLVGFSRAYLGVHWPTDILAGWSVGAAWAVACALVAQRLQRNRTVEGPEPEPGEEAASG
jgi:undecaprenyl-diphosphatase